MLNVIAAVAQNGVIGTNGKLPFDLKKDMARFKNLTANNVVIMGKNTYLSIGSPLKNRINIIISSTLGAPDGAYVVRTLDEAVKLARALAPDKEIFAIGGQRVYKESLLIADRLYITLVECTPQGDSYFPQIPDCFKISRSERILDNGLNTVFNVYERICR